MIRKNAGKVLVLLGVLVICAGVGMKGFVVFRQKQIEKNYFTTFAPEQGEEPCPAEPAKNLRTEETQNSAIAILSIRALALQAPVQEGTSLDVLRESVGHFTGTAYPGENGNFAVAAHDSNLFAEYFKNLHKLVKGDEITVQYGKETFAYAVTESFVTSASNLSVLEPAQEGQITLVTCAQNGKKRLVVKGSLKT